MNPLSGGLVARLSRSRLNARWARAEVGLGERASRAVGSGLEFAEHRPYQPGDDLRHLDRHAYARFREPYVKRFAAERGLDVTLLLDRSASMAVGTPTKHRFAATLAGGIACAALAGGDRLRVGLFAGAGRIDWHPSISGIGRLRDVAGWLAGEASDEGATDLAAVAALAQQRLPSHGLLVVLSDWWTDDPATAVRAFARGGREVVVVHVLAPEEEDPSTDDEGVVRMQDAETGEILEVALDAEACGRYAKRLEAWRASLRDEVSVVHGRYLPVRCDAPAEDVLLHDWRKAGLLT